MRPHARIKQNQISLLRLAASQAGMDWEDLKARAGVKSSREITNAICDELMDHFKKNYGFVYRPKVKKAPPLRKQARNKKTHLGAIQAALGALGKDWAYADGIARQMFGVDQAEWCSPGQLHDLQTALIYQERRLAGDPPQSRPETLAKRRMRTQRRKDAKAQEMEEVNG